MFMGLIWNLFSGQSVLQTRIHVVSVWKCFPSKWIYWQSPILYHDYILLHCRLHVHCIVWLLQLISQEACIRREYRELRVSPVKKKQFELKWKNGFELPDSCSLPTRYFMTAAMFRNALKWKRCVMNITINFVWLCI